GIEVKTQTRFPPGKIERIDYASDAAAVTMCRQLLGQESTVDETVADEWLEEQGLNRGESYPHDQCPIESGRESHGKPVWIGDSGIYCHSCNSRGDGFRSWSQLVDGERISRKLNPLKAAAK